MKKIRIILSVFAVALICFANVTFAYDCGELTYGLDISPSDSFIIDEKPKVIFRHILPEEHISSYHVQLYVDDVVTDTITIRNSETMVENIYEFPVYTEGEHVLGVKVLKDGNIEAEYQYTKSYVKSVLPGYNNRGFNTHYSHDAAYDNKDTLLYKAIGADVYRDTYYWWKSEPTQKGVYVFDQYINLEQVCCLTGENPMYTNTQGNIKITDDEQIEGFANFALEAAKRLPYKTFEIYNEAAFKYTGSEYAKFALAAAKKIKEYNPEIQVIVGCVIDNDNGTEKRIEFAKNFMTDEMYPYIDAISFHLYSPDNYADDSKFNTQSGEYIDLIKEYGGWKELAMTESGWALGSWAKVTEDKQASELVKRMIIADDMKFSFMTLYEFKNSRVEDENGFENNLGIIELDKKIRPAYYSLKNYFKNTNKAQYIGRVKLSDGIKAYAYAANGNYFLIAWAENTDPDLLIHKTSHSGASYTFNEEVKITDMFGNSIEGNTLITDYTPKYVHNISSQQILKLISDYGTTDIIPTTELVSAGYKSEAEQIAVLYNNICTEISVDKVKEYVEYCYDLGDRIAKTNTISKKELSNLLSEIDKAAEAGANLIVCCSECPEQEVSFNYKIQKSRFEDLIGFSDRSETKYLSEPYEKSRDIMNKINKYEKCELIKPIYGENYILESTGVLKVSFASDEHLKTVRILKNDDVIYLNTFEEGTDGFEYDLPEKGNYTLEINEGEKNITTISYVDNGYISIEDKMSYIGMLRCERLFNWSKLLMNDYIMNVKGYMLPETMNIETSDDRTYIVIKYPDTEYDCYVALYNNDKLIYVKKAEDGICRLDVTELEDYSMLRSFVWEEMTPKFNVDEYDGFSVK